MIQRGGGGGRGNDHEEDDGDRSDIPLQEHESVVPAPAILAEQTSSVADTMKEPEADESYVQRPSKHRKVRHTSEVIYDLLKGNGLAPESYPLRQLIQARADAYIEEIMAMEDEGNEEDSDESGKSKGNDRQRRQRGRKLPHPRQYLHFIAPKISAIRQSPDITLRIQSARANVDAGDAACIIGMMARLCDLYDREQQLVSDSDSSTSGRRKRNDDDKDRDRAAGIDILGDRRFEQLVECVLCGVDVRKRKREYQLMMANTNHSSSFVEENIEELLEEDEIHVDEGLSVRDSCRAAWGLALLGGYHLGDFGNGVASSDILRALGLQARELLLSKLQRLRNGDIDSEDSEHHADSLELSSSSSPVILSSSERFNMAAEELAEDACTVMWAFSCVKACTGLRFPALFESCCSILCQNPVDLMRRAQIEDGTGVISKSPVEVEDVLDRLERAQNNQTKADDTAPSEESNENPLRFEDVSLFDRLSPNEATDVMWSLALHGSTGKEKSTKLELTLSETASALRELAFDRILDSLEADLLALQQRRSHREREKMTVSMRQSTSETAPVLVEVIDAAKVLSSEYSEDEVTASVENMAVSQSPGPQVVEQVEVMDAETILAQEALGMESFEPEIYVKPSSTEMVSTELSSSDEKSNAEGNDGSSGPMFSPRDLCCIAWAVTDLGDSLRERVVEGVTNVFIHSGIALMEELHGTNLANMAWAIARQVNAMDLSVGWSKAASSLLELTSWIAGSALRLVQDDDGVEAVLQEFQPPELGRLMWSLATTVSRLSKVCDSVPDLGAMRTLAKMVLQTADWNVSIFGTEDLARVAWAFLVFNHNQDIEIGVAGALGRAMSTMEGSVLRWESGQCGHHNKGETEQAHDQTNRFATFLGKARNSFAALDQRIAAYSEDEDDESNESITSESRLPLLRDLTMDPATICKLSSAFARLRETHDGIEGSWSFVAVAVRLLVAKNAQLLKECAAIDIIHLCYACAMNDVAGYEREYVARLFARRVLQLINDRYASEPEKDLAEILHVSAHEAATLVWSLGTLGVKHVSSDSNSTIAYRKLRLVTNEDSILKIDKLEHLETSEKVLLLSGLTHMGLAGSKPQIVIRVLASLATNILPSDYATSYNALECASQLIRSIKGTGEPRPTTAGFAKEKETDHLSSREVVEDREVESLEQEDKEEEKDEEEKDDAVIDKLHEHDDLTTRLLSDAEAFISSILQQFIPIVPSMTAEEIRQLLLIVSSSPFQCDDLVLEISEEVEHRLEALLLSPESATRLLDGSENWARQAKESLLRTSETDDLTLLEELLRKGAKTASDRNSDDEVTESDEETTDFSIAKVVDTVSRTTSSILNAKRRLDELEEASGSEVSIDTVFRKQGLAFELGRCLELIETYQRIDFENGTRKSRYDRARRNDVGKRLLSRLFF